MEKSYLWTTGGAGDGAATYTRSDWQIIAKILSSVTGDEGVGSGSLNGLLATATAANQVTVQSGRALVDGKPYQSDAGVIVTIPSAVGGGNTRIDRIVLRADWAAQTVRITKISGVDAASPTAPAVQSSSGSSWDLLLWQARVDTAGVVTLTDERIFGLLSGAALAGGSIPTSALADGAVTTVKIADSNITLAKMADNSVGTSEIVNAAVTTGKLADLSVTGAKIANATIGMDKLVTPSIVKIAEYLGDGATSANFLNIPQTYRHLLIEYYARSNRASGGTMVDLLNMQFNGDYGGGSYNYNDADGGAMILAGWINWSVVPNDQFPTLKFAAGQIRIPNYANEIGHKHVVGDRSTWDSAAAWLPIKQRYGAWLNTAAITSVNLFLDTGQFRAGTVISLYGLP